MMKVQLCLLFCTTCREEIPLKATVNVNIYHLSHDVDSEALRQLQYSSIFCIQVVTLRIIGDCFGNNR